MSFLQKFKGKTTFLSKTQVKEILGERNQIQKRSQNEGTFEHIKFMNKNDQNQDLFTRNSSNQLIKIGKNLMRDSKVKQIKLNPQKFAQTKKVIQNPFLVQNQFFLDEEQHQQTLKKRRQKQIYERVQKEKKKRQQIQEIMMKSLQKSSNQTSKYVKKQWIKMGGLGPNIGGEQWTKKKSLYEKMTKFAQEVKNRNKTSQNSQKLRKSQSIKSQKPIKKNITSRDIAIKYSKTVQKPSSFIFQKTELTQMQKNPSLKSEKNARIFPPIERKSLHLFQSISDPMENQFSSLNFQRNYSQFQRYQDKHQKYKKLVSQNL